MNKTFGLLICTLIFLSSCARVLVETPIAIEKLPHKKEKELIAIIDSLSLIKPNSLYSKLDVKYSDSSRTISFKTSLKIVKDSAINLLITYAKIPIVTAQVTKDSIIVVNKRDKCFEKESLTYIKDMFGIDLSLLNLEEIFLGRPLDYDPKNKYFLVHDPYSYTISTHKKREQKKMERHSKEDVILKYQINKTADNLETIFIDSPSDSTAISIHYISRQLLNGINLPKDVEVNIDGKKNKIKMIISYDKVEINEPQELFIIIPENYEKCN